MILTSMVKLFGCYEVLQILVIHSDFHRVHYSFEKVPLFLIAHIIANIFLLYIT